MDTLRCQSCGMPLGVGYYGTLADGSQTHEYCTFCFQKGNFTDSTMTLSKMIDRSIENMTTDLKMEKDAAIALANKVIPHLGRWKRDAEK